MNMQSNKRFYKLLASLAIIISTFFLVGYMVFARNAIPDENSVLKQENKRMKSQLVEWESKEKTKEITEQLAEQFLLAMSANKPELVESLVIQEATVSEDFSIDFGNFSYEKGNEEDIAFIKLSDYGYIQDISPKQREKFKLQYMVHFQSQDTPLIYTFYFVSKDENWLIEAIENEF